ncbi:MAG: pyruvate/2-oxoglutarate dehydrogenase complex dihydrolipoamide dehydrogenase (E3) component [Alphaproteobacteria bacterium]|jgi:pyruvate/2-oxoglutarate dehydrogenase complex dihydrolipoamide dehydrogenase (E3) component
MKHYDIIIIGAGSAGLTMAAVSANLGHKVALIEGHKMGGDCLNYGCVPSKALLAQAKQKTTDFKQVKTAIKNAIDTIAPHDSVERFESLGCDIYQENTYFKNDQTVVVGNNEITAKRFVIATGASTFIPPIAGLNDVHYLTNENIFELDTCPKHLIIVGGGAIGIEMAFAYINLGAEVTLLEVSHSILPQSNKDAVNILRDKLKNLGVRIIERAEISAVKNDDKQISMQLEGEKISGSHLLIATGRKANIDHLQLEHAGIEFTAKGINVDKTLRTNKKHIYAIGDCSSKYQFTHVASFEASLVIKRSLFGLFHSKINYNAVPKVIYTNPELAETGISEKEVLEQYDASDIRIIKVLYSDVHRAICDNKTTGFAKVITTKKGYILGACIIGEAAGELITPWTTLIAHKRKISDLSSVTVPYPSYSEINKQVASAFYKDSFYSEKVKCISKWLFKLLG